jgi:hypothetical protein
MIIPTPESKDYFEQFDYTIAVRLGRTYTPEFKEFTAWCDLHLGTRYKDWFIISSGPNIYTLTCRNNKRATFLALTWIDVIC